MKLVLLMASLCLVSVLDLLATPYERCIEECVASGVGDATCRYEACDPADTVGIEAGQGNPLQLFSYELIGPAPVIDGSLMSRNGVPDELDALDEWKAACSRTLILNDSGVVQLFLTNTLDTLYLGITYEHGNNSDGCGVALYFDEGSGSPLDGSADYRLTNQAGASNEQAMIITKAGGTFALEDMSWNGTAWVADGDGAVDFLASRYFFSSDQKVHHYEFGIPLNNDKNDDSLNSDLDVSPYDDIGLYVQVIKMGAGAGTWHWLETNGLVAAPDSFPHWGRISLSVKRQYFTFFTGKPQGDPPVIDGSISEAAWTGAYQRDLVLSNYHYGTIPARIWCLEDDSEDYIYIGARIYDATASQDDFCQVYFEEVGENATDSIRDYDLDHLAENSLRITNSGALTDLNWDLDQGAWITDTETADDQAAAAAAASGYTDYEFRILRSAAQEDIDIPRKGLLGFLLRYHDADRGTDDRTEFYWEYTTNNDAQLLDQHSNPGNYLSTGWTNLQLGGPHIAVVSPASNQSFFTSTDVSVSVGTADVTGVQHFTVNDTATKTDLVDQGGGVWSVEWNVDGVLPHPDTVIVRVTTGDGNFSERMIAVWVNMDPAGIIPGPGQPGSLTGFRLGRNRPNPFSAETYLKIFLPQGRPAGQVRLLVYDLSGRLLRTLFDGYLDSGSYGFVFDGTTDKGNALEAGTYLCEMKARNFSQVRKLVLISNR
ncbi:FlgD immunoglobulin-like domain containing protein [Fibrobacterota bacterium]